MSELLQTGQHPDADQLSAFVEHALPAHEHESMLAHLAVCPDCRSVVAVSMPPMEELPQVQPVPVRRPWFSGWKLVWPVAVAFTALILIVVLVRKGGGDAPPTQIAETHLPEKPAIVGGVAPAQAGLLAAKGASPSPTTQGSLAGPVQAAKAADRKAVAEPKVEDQSLAHLPLDGRNIESLPPSPGAAPPRAVGGMAMGNGSGSGLAQQAQVLGRGLNVQQQPSVSAGQPAAAPPTAHAMNGLAVVPPAGSPAPPLPPPAAVAPTGSGSNRAEGVSTGAAVGTIALDATSDDSLAAESDANASSTVISAASPATLAKAGRAALHPLPSGLPVLSVATAGQTMLALDSGNGLFLSGDGGTHWKRVRTKWQGRAVKVALAVTPSVVTQQTVVVNGPASPGELEGRISTATEAAASAPVGGGATLTGLVTDPAGAVIPGASVTVTNAATGAAVRARTDAAGRYSASGLAAGTYRIDASAQGFARQELNVTLAASQQEKADLKLQVGQMTETVTVTNSPVQLETENAALSDQVVVQPKPKKGAAAPVFAITTDAGERWVSADGQSWKRE